jgi:hypothetical protein
MSKLEVNAIEPQSGTTLTLGASGDTITIPAGATISNSGTAAGFGPTGAVSWNTTKITANPNPAVTGVGYFCDTTTAAFTVTLPSSPSAGAVIGITDYANTFATNNLTVGRNSSKIGGVAANAILSTNGIAVTFVYVDATQGWIVTDSGNRSDLPPPQYIAATGGCVATCGNYKIHTFTGPGTFTITNAGNPGGSSTVDYLVVAGGGGGGGYYYSGGGGAGGFRESVPSPAAWTASPLATSTSLPVSATGYPITVGGGGNFGPSNTPGTSGTNSIFSTITSAGGGAGGSATPAALALTGGSGGGQGAITPAASVASGNTPPVSPPQGQPGGTFTLGPNSASGGLGAGGGGATQAGNNPTTNGTSPAAAGGNGATTSISGSPTAYAGGGGGGGNFSGSIAGGAGGTGGGGSGAGSSASVAGTANRGGGGGGGSHCGNPNTNGSAGGSGVVVIRYKFQ